jgi:hypothetical protein
MLSMCPVCQVRDAAIGVLCIECRDDIAPPVRTTPEQVQLHGGSSADATLVDFWGRPHALSPSMLIGRNVEGEGLALLEGSISRHHARIELEGGAWTVRDLSSANGTYVDDQLVEGPTALHPGARVRFGQLAFFFLPTRSPLQPPAHVESATALIPRAAAGSGELALGGALEAVRQSDDEEVTDVGLPLITLRLHEPTGGGGGFVELDGKRVQLTSTQLELISLMVQRMNEDTAAPPLVRGFVRSSELIASLSWDTLEPNENHVKQLIRRVRRALMKVAHGDLIESRHRFGYRLRAIPRVE